MTKHAEQLIGLIEYVRGVQEGFFASLPEDERVANGTWEVWAPKDVIAHLTFWQNNLLVNLRALDQQPVEQEPFEVRNNKNYLNYQMQPWDVVYGDYSKSLDEIIERVKAYSDAELTTPNHFPRIANGILQNLVLGNTYSHNITHLGELISKRGTTADGLKLQEEATQKWVAFDDSPQSKGTALYNLACAYALTGDATRTVELLKEGLALRPVLIEFSKEDPDFNLVRETPEFQAMYGEKEPTTA